MEQTPGPSTSTVLAPLRARAVLLGDRLVIDRARYTRVLSTTPFCFREGEGFVVIFRYGAVVLIGLPPEAEDAVLAQYAGDVANAKPVEEERVSIELFPGREEGPMPDGTLHVGELSLAHVLVLADVLAKSVALARYEREIASVFDTIEPAADALATKGKLPTARKPLLKLIGAALLAQHRVSGRIAFAEKPDALWEHPELERFYARLEDEYEIVERGTLLNGNVAVVGSAAETFTDIIDTARSARLEILIVLLIFAELVIAGAALLRQ
ncbi:MAG TPA: RMD1 family protein [Rhizomicrobium sp.]